MLIHEINNFTFGKKYPTVPATELAEKIEQGLTIDALATKYNLPRHVIYKSIQHGRVKSYRQIKTEELNNSILKLHRKGFTIKELQEKFGYTLEVIQRALDTLKSPSERLIDNIMNKLKLDPSVLENLK